MNKTVVGFIKAGLVWLLIGSVVGGLMLVWPKYTGIYLRVHAHMMVVGFVSMLIFGVAYHILPRFSGRPLHSERLASAHLWLLNIGLAGMTTFWSFHYHFGKILYQHISLLFAILMFISFVMFAYNLFKTVRAVTPP